MSWDWYSEYGPRKTAHGIQAQSGKFGKTWWASRWLAALEQLVDRNRLGRGRSYARTGQVLNIEIKPGLVKGRVQGSRTTPYRVTIKMKPLSTKEWQRVVRAMATEAIFTAKLLAGEMPQEVERAFGTARSSLFPASAGDLQTECSCPDWANPCKHIAAVYYLLGEQFDADPFLLFRLRGKGKEEIVSMLRAQRTSDEASSRPLSPRRVEAKTLDAAATPPLAECLDRFWESPEPTKEFQVDIQMPSVDAVPVKRLGVPGFWHDKADWFALFTATYRSISRAALETV